MVFDNSNNPFAHYGTIVYGPKFYGRLKELMDVKSRAASGNLAVIGEPRIGKSSLVYEALVNSEINSNENQMVTIWMDLSTFDCERSFFVALVNSCRDELIKNKLVSEPIIQAESDFKEKNQKVWVVFQFALKNYFKTVRKTGVRIRFIIDEFDAARKLFCKKEYAFQQLRELSYKPETGIIWVTISRRTIKHIEEQSGAISTFDGVFNKLFLKTFHENEINPFFQRLQFKDPNITDKWKNILFEYTGFHPYLMDIIGFHFVQKKNENLTLDFLGVCIEQSATIRDHYKTVADFLEKEGDLSKLIQIVFGPTYDVNLNDVDRLTQYGLINKYADKNKAFSLHFEAFLYARSISIEIWPLWSETERGLRELILYFLKNKFGEDWLNPLLKNSMQLKPILDNCKDKQAKIKANHGINLTDSLLDFSYPSDLFAIMKIDWGWFKQIFNGDKNDWSKKFELLSKIRTPLSHNRPIYPGEKDQTIGICKSIIELLSFWEKQGKP